MEPSDIVITPQLGGWGGRRSPTPIKISDFTSANEIEIVPNYDTIEPTELMIPEADSRKESEDKSSDDVLTEILRIISEIKDILNERLSDSTRKGGRERSGASEYIKFSRAPRHHSIDKYRNHRLSYSS